MSALVCPIAVLVAISLGATCQSRRIGIDSWQFWPIFIAPCLMYAVGYMSGKGLL